MIKSFLQLFGSSSNSPAAIELAHVVQHLLPIEEPQSSVSPKADVVDALPLPEQALPDGVLPAPNPWVETPGMTEGQKTIARIHAEFFNASGIVENMLHKRAKKAEAAAKNATLDSERHKLMRDAGFTGTKEAQELAAAEQEKSFREFDADLANKVSKKLTEYTIQYPGYKFITRPIVDKIAKKYNLVVGPVRAYKGFVPTAKLKQIAAFNGKFDKEAHKPLKRYRLLEFSCRPENQHTLDAELLKRPNGVYSRDELISVYNGTAFLKRGNAVMVSNNVSELNNEETLIVAPASDMDLTGLTQDGTHFLQATRLEKQEIKDPIVLQPVTYGYLIIAAWGDEASDPDVVNSMHN